MSESYVIDMNHNCAPLSELLASKIETTSAGVCCLHAQLQPENREAAAMSLACSIAERRLPKNNRYFESWHQRATGEIDETIGETEALVLQAAVLENVGTPAYPAMDQHFLGLVAETIWQGVIVDANVGLGIPIRVEGHDYSVTDPGGDGLTVYISNGDYCYRLWESKYHGNDRQLRLTVNNACRQVSNRALQYLARFSVIEQHLVDDDLAGFYGRLTELWADKDQHAGVGIAVGADSSFRERRNGCFEGMNGYFELTADQHQGNLNLVEDYQAFSESMRRVLWKGCGLWNAC